MKELIALYVAIVLVVVVSSFAYAEHRIQHHVFRNMLYVGEQSDSPPGRTIRLRGRLFASEEDASSGKFFTDPEGESESLTLQALDGGFVHQWLKGSVGTDAEITITVRRHP